LACSCDRLRLNAPASFDSLGSPNVAGCSAFLSFPGSPDLANSGNQRTDPLGELRGIARDFGDESTV
jgi:hypothetical protein